MNIPILKSITPDKWVKDALNNLELILLDHASCEKKAAQTALHLINRYPSKDLSVKFSNLAREELLHYEKVLKHIDILGIKFRAISSSRYAKTLHSHIRKMQPDRFVDTMLVCAFMEARSCERFSALIPNLSGKLKSFYEKLLDSEFRHYEVFIGLAKSHSKHDISTRVEYFSNVDNDLINSQDTEIRFHSGVIN